MKTLIEGYRIYPGDHCGSSTMRGLLHHYCGLELPEAAVFGLGAGIDAMFLSSPSMDPPKVLFGRTATMELDLGSSLQVDYREQVEPDDAVAWQVVRDEVLAGRPTMLSGDILYLDYREFKVHFPGHRFVLLGFDDAIEKVYIADRIRDEPELCSYQALATSRNPPEGLPGNNLWGRFHGTEVGRSLPEAARFAIARASARMLGSEPQATGGGALPSEGVQVVSGVAAIERFADELPGWAERDDATWLASYNARCIEKFGNGGGNFRRLYAGFLEWAGKLAPGVVPDEGPALATRAADGWTAASEALGAASQEGAPLSCWEDAARHARVTAAVERELFERLASSVGAPPA